MNRGLSLGVLLVAVVAFLGVGLLYCDQADARSQYCKAFIGHYEAVKEAKETKCNICHVPDKDKEERNNYGICLSKLLGAENVKDEAKIKEAFKAAEGQKSAVEGKTFGDLLKDGKLPASK